MSGTNTRSGDLCARAIGEAISTQRRRTRAQAQAHRFHRPTVLLTGHLRLSGDANWAQCGGTTARRRRRLPRDDSVLSRCFGTSHCRAQPPGAPVAPSEADAMKPQVTPVLAGAATAVLVAAAIEFGRRSALLRRRPLEDITYWLLASGGAARQQLANQRRLPMALRLAWHIRGNNKGD